MTLIRPTRRGFIQAAGFGAASVALGAPGLGRAQSYPDRPINVTIPTGEGGGADRDSRVFASVWTKYLGADLEYGYYPGAAGQVGYEFYMQRDKDAYNLIFANLGPEVIMLELQDTGIVIGEDIVYIQQISSEPMAVFSSGRSPITSLQQLVDEGKKRPVTVAVSRLPHPGSIGMLALAEATGANFVLVPYGGGNPSAMAAITMETDCCVLPMANPIALIDQVNILGVFAGANPAPAESKGAPTVNGALGTSIPNFDSSRAWGIHKEAYDAFPDRVAHLKQIMNEAVNDPAYAEAVKGAGLPTTFIDVGGEDVAMATAAATKELAAKYKTLLSGA
ncbi:Bug family tripartite tricarboxylate transporter substrate binding protein [Rubrimonas cliftonensis]|uniref:Tripartite-type tricarboxylate transporter, receptor component TctC n=1 Tax=Rubrimonas cliftonensis TaxID=89524 RepID=A0A1H4CNB8_9RHOB|nr:tripartite tricarboxylate transporter substrate-binding protein [Rubrimonas cliftonensis]SEA61827.1 Tripartite-type tricarboxylate transporter, receptor component TctC [Rubrimonas cliftonensis]